MLGRQDSDNKKRHVRHASASQLRGWRTACTELELNTHLLAYKKLWKQKHGVDVAGDPSAVFSLSQKAMKRPAMSNREAVSNAGDHDHAILEACVAPVDDSSREVLAMGVAFGMTVLLHAHRIQCENCV